MQPNPVLPIHFLSPPLLIQLLLLICFCFLFSVLFPAFLLAQKKLLFIHPEGLISCAMSQCKERGRWDSACRPDKDYFF